MAINIKTFSITEVHFPDLNLNTYDNLSNQKLALNVKLKVKLSANDQTRAVSLKIRVITGFC